MCRQHICISLAIIQCSMPDRFSSSSQLSKFCDGMRVQITIILFNLLKLQAIRNIVIDDNTWRLNAYLTLVAWQSWGVHSFSSTARLFSNFLNWSCRGPWVGMWTSEVSVSNWRPISLGHRAVWVALVRVLISGITRSVHSLLEWLGRSQLTKWRRVNYFMSLIAQQLLPRIMYKMTQRCYLATKWYRVWVTHHDIYGFESLPYHSTWWVIKELNRSWNAEERVSGMTFIKLLSDWARRMMYLTSKG